MPTTKLQILVLAGALLLLDCAHDKTAGGAAGAAGNSLRDAAVADASRGTDARTPTQDAAMRMDAHAQLDGSQDTDDAARADAGPEATPKSICKKGAVYGAPLSAATLTATKVVENFAFTEGPVWIASESALLFSDIQPGAGPDNVQPSKIQRLKLPATTDLWLDNSGNNGMALAADGSSLIACTHDSQSVSIYNLATKQRTSLVSAYMGRKFHSPNDVAVRSDGTVYFTDPNFQQGNRNTNIVTGTSVYRVAKNGTVSVVDASIGNPNGIALSPDENTLYVGGSGQVFKYAVNADGSTGAQQPFASGLSSPDGMTVDCAGNLYVAEFGTGKVVVYSSAGGPAIGTISASMYATNAAFGGADGKTLFITSGGAATGGWGVYSITLGVPGLPY